MIVFFNLVTVFIRNIYLFSYVICIALFLWFRIFGHRWHSTLHRREMNSFLVNFANNYLHKQIQLEYMEEDPTVHRVMVTEDGIRNRITLNPMDRQRSLFESLDNIHWKSYIPSKEIATCRTK